MATLLKRKRANGTIAYTAQIRIKHLGKMIHHESKTFDKRKAAQQWAKLREVELQLSSRQSCTEVFSDTRLNQLLQRYISEVDPVKPLGKTKKHALGRLQKYPLSEKNVHDLSTSDIIDFCKFRSISEKAGPHTINADLSYIRSVIALCKPAWNIPVSTAFLDEAKPILKQLNLIGSSSKRSRRLESGEFDCILEALKKHDMSKRSFIPLATIFKFSIYSLMRVGEICRIKWPDLDKRSRTIIIRERKDPNNKKDNDQEVALLGPAWDIVENLPVIDERIFPYNSRSISQIFSNYMTRLSVTNLRYHDLRREGISRLIEMGYSVEEVATVSGHKNLRTIWDVYTQIKSESLHDKWIRLNDK